MMPIMNVKYVPDARCSLFSLTAVEDKGFQVKFNDGKCFIMDGNGVKATGYRKQNLYELDFIVDQPSCSASLYDVSVVTWHRRLGHVNMKKVSQTLGLKVDGSIMQSCEPCIMGKMHKNSIPKAVKVRESQPGSVIHMDLAGPMRTDSTGGARYFLLLKDDCSGLMFVYFIREKNQVINKMKEFLIDWYALTNGIKIRCMRSDNGTEFVNAGVKNLLINERIKHEVSTPYVPQQNGTIERAMRTVCESARAMLHGNNCPTHLWGEAVATAVHIMNRIPCYDMKESPLEIVTGSKPDISHLREFGSKAFVHVRDQQRSKWQPKAKEAILVGYNAGSKSYRLWDQDARSIINSKDVTVIESSQDQDIEVIVPGDMDQDQYRDDHHDDHEDDQHQDSEEGSDDESDQNSLNLDTTSESDPPVPPPRTTSAAKKKKIEPQPSFIQLRPQVRKNYKDMQRAGSSGMQRQKGKAAPKVKVIVDRGGKDFASFAVDGPQTFSEAVNADDKDKWVDAMNDEMHSHEKNGTWELVPRDKSMNIVKNKWIFVVKRKADGSIDRYRARLVAKGFSQKPGIDYKETFSPVARYDTIRMLLSFVPVMKWKVTQFDVKTAFLNGDLNETVYMEQPEGFQQQPDQLVCKLKKSLYGLKQSPRQWSQKLSEIMQQFGFRGTLSDPCVFVNHDTGVIVCIYVDDGLIFAPNEEASKAMINNLSSKLELSVGDPETYAGMQIEYGTQHVFIHQSSFLDRVIKRFDLQDAKPASTPADAHVKLEKGDTSIDHDTPFRELVGSLMYLAVVTRPDIAYAVSRVSQYMTCYDNSHMTAAKRIIQYLKATRDMGIVYEDSGRAIHAFSDSDFAGDHETRRSRTGSVIMTNGGPIVWTSTRQPIVTLSSSEAEFVAANTSVTSLIWINELIRELGLEHEGMCLFIDNQSAIKMIRNPEFHMRTKHIDVRYKYIRERFQEGLFGIEYIPTEENVADIMTKALSAGPFKKHRDQLVLG